jgi:steroid delta-isomerase-like uncharacterized protein
MEDNMKWRLLVLFVLLVSLIPVTAQESDLEANKALVEAYVAVLNSHDLDGMDALISADFIEHNPFVMDAPPGPEAFKMILGGILAAFPDVEITIELIAAEGDLVATRHLVNATHEGAFNGVPATGNSVTWTENHLFRIADGVIVEHWAELNAVGLLTQIGALPAPE